MGEAGIVSRYAFAKKDTNHNLVAAEFERLGWAVEDTSRLGGDFPDMLIAKNTARRITCLIEVKMPGEKLTPGQLKFATHWPGEIEVARTLEDVLKIDRRLQA